MIIGKSPVVIATLMAVLLNLTLPKDGQTRKGIFHRHDKS